MRADELTSAGATPELTLEWIGGAVEGQRGAASSEQQCHSHCSASTSNSDHPSLSVPAPVRTSSRGHSALQQGHLHHCPHLHFYDNAAVVLGTGRVVSLKSLVHGLQGVGKSTSGAPSTLFLCEMKALPGSSAPAEARGWKPG